LNPDQPIPVDLYDMPLIIRSQPTPCGCPLMSSRESDHIGSAQETLDILFDISQLLNAQLDKETLATCVGLIESGVNAEALAAIIQELRRKSTALSAQTPARGQ